jgi:hypothetical protein
MYKPVEVLIWENVSGQRVLINTPVPIGVTDKVTETGGDLCKGQK